MTADQPTSAPTAWTSGQQPLAAAPRHGAQHDVAQCPAFDAAYAQCLGAHRPSGTVACVAEHHDGVAVELQAVAAVGSAG